MVFTCEDHIGAAMTCIYDAWEWALKGGHEQVRLKKEPILQSSFLDEYIHVEEDPEKARKVARSIQKKIGMDAYLSVCYGILYKEDMLNVVYKYLRLGFQVGKQINSFLTEPVVMEMMEIRRKVGNEAHLWRELLRFDKVNGYYVAHLDGKSDIVEIVGNHFADRMPSEDWMIIDDRRKKAMVHPKDERSYLYHMTLEEWEKMKETEKQTDGFSELWNVFFQYTAIKERENLKCQRNHFPLWMRTHATEFR